MFSRMEFQRSCEKCGEVLVWMDDEDNLGRQYAYLLCRTCGYREEPQADIEAHAEGRPRLPGM